MLVPLLLHFYNYRPYVWILHKQNTSFFLLLSVYSLLFFFPTFLVVSTLFLLFSPLILSSLLPSFSPFLLFFFFALLYPISLHTLFSSVPYLPISFINLIVSSSPYCPIISSIFNWVKSTIPRFIAAMLFDNRNYSKNLSLTVLSLTVVN